MNPDKDRLDWLEASGASLYAFRLDNGRIGAWGCHHEEMGWCRGATARDAIDMTRELVGEIEPERTVVPPDAAKALFRSMREQATKES